MFLKSLKIENTNSIIRDIHFHKGINLIVDETLSTNRQESGNNVGKTTVLRLIDFCLGGKGENIYKDTEFKTKSNTQIENFLKENNIIVTLTLTESLDNTNSDQIVIKRNFRSYSEKIQDINGEHLNDTEFAEQLKSLIFNTTQIKPSFRQIISKNIRDEKNKLTNTVKVLHNTTTLEEYEALYLFWLGINLNNINRKQVLNTQKKIEESLQKRLSKSSTISQIEQAIIVIDREIKNLEEKKLTFNLNDHYEIDLDTLNEIKSKINHISTEVARVELRRKLIIESKEDLEKDTAKIDASKVKSLYEQAKVFIPSLQISFDETIRFHNQMIKEKISYITKELPEIEGLLSNLKIEIQHLLIQEKQYTEKLRKTGAIEELQNLISQLNRSYEKRGSQEGLKDLWIESQTRLDEINIELSQIDLQIASKDHLIQNRITEFNKFFSDISNRLYGEQFILSSEKKERGYELNISTISGNLGTGKKKGQIAAFDIAYIQFADSLGIKCLHFVLHDQLETVHGNQILSLITKIVAETNCQYIVPVLKDKLPNDIDVSPYIILSLSQRDKLFKQ